MSNTEWGISLIHPCPFRDFWTSITYPVSHLFSKLKVLDHYPFKYMESVWPSLSHFEPFMFICAIFFLLVNENNCTQCPRCKQVIDLYCGIMKGFLACHSFLIKKAYQMLAVGLYHWAGGFMELPVTKITPPPPLCQDSLFS